MLVLSFNWRDFRDQRTQLLWIALLTLAFALLFQGNRGLWGPDEGRFSNVALQMIQSGNWIEPLRHPDFVEYAKPPLTYWAVAASLMVFGKAEWALRLPSALAFFGTTVLIFWLAKRLMPKRPWLAPVLYVSNVVPFCAANLLTADSLLTFFETLGVLAFVSMWQSEHIERARIWRRVMWLAFALAFLTKGPPALLPLLALVLFRKFSGLRFPVSMVGFDGPMVLLAVGLPWFAYIAGRDPAGFNAFRGFYAPLLQQTQSGGFFDNLVVYGPILLLGLVPWGVIAGLLALTQYRSAVKHYFEHMRWERFRQIHQESLFLLTWFLVPLLVLCAVQIRLWLYVLPLLVPMSLVIARALQQLRVKRWMLIGGLFWAAILLGIKGYAPQFEGPTDAKRFAQALQANHVVPAEIAALDVAPIYGLKFYLNTNLLKVSNGSRPDASFDLELKDYLRRQAAGPQNAIASARNERPFWLISDRNPDSLVSLQRAYAGRCKLILAQDNMRLLQCAQAASLH